MATGQTTNYNIPYPVSTDPVNVHSDIQSLAVSVDTLFNSGVTTSKANAFTNTNTFSANSASSAITITQTGAGNALTVEDSSPDSTPFIIDASGNVGIGKTTASVPLDVVGAGTFSGTVTANTFSGSGASLTSLNGTNISSGTVAAARIDTAIARVATPTFTGTVILPTGGTVSAPLKFIAGTNLTTPVAGSVEYDGTVFYSTTNATTGRGVIPSVLFTSGTATFTNVSTAQAIFPGANDTLSLATGTYIVEAVINIATSGAASNSLGFSILGNGGATLGTVSLAVTSTNGNAATTNTASTTYVTASGNTSVTAAVTAATNRTLTIKGIIRCTVAGTIVPQITYSAAPGAVPTGQASNFMVLYPVGSSTVVSNGTWV